ncbi:sterol desaturase family protein [Cognatishimia sp. WU-CL00825]|uniref:sterol desaturase family protein n=1 Tax=Cognatishimia sp. WU-CL00825 TaxID=3127658 RepID=UPI0031055C62
MQSKETNQNSVPAGRSKEWNYHPKLPIAMSPVFDIPPKPKATIAWLFGTWLKLSPPVNHLVFALLAVAFLLPSSSDMQSLDASWMLQIAAIFFGTVIFLGSALHVYLYVFASQKMRLKFDVRPMEKSSRFTFGDQVWDNVFWSLTSGVVALTAWNIFYFFFAANGWAPTLSSISASPVWFVAFFFVLRFWQSFHFYWIHRLIHMPWLFKNVHHLHHRNVNVGPWSGLAMHPVESFFYFSSIIIHLILPTHPLHVMFHMFSLSLGALISHAGFDKLIVRNKESVNAGSFHHQLHHRYFECNYGSEEIPLDRWFGSFHDGTVEATQRIRARKKLIFAPK